MNGTSVSKGLMAIAAICVAGVLGAGAAVAAHNLGGARATVNGANAVHQALPLRQDNDYPVLSSSFKGGIQAHPGRRGGTIDDSTTPAGLAADGNGPSSDLTRVLPGSSAAVAAPERSTGHKELP